MKLIEQIDTMTHSHVQQYVVPGLTSSLVGGNGCGTVRLFSSDRDTREWVTPHSHRFDFVCLVLEGEVENITFSLGDGPGANLYSQGSIRARLGGMGNYEITRIGNIGFYTEESTKYSAGEMYSMSSQQIHSIRFSRGARVLFFEGPEVTHDSLFLEPYSNGKVIRTFKTEDWMFEAQ